MSEANHNRREFACNTCITTTDVGLLEAIEANMTGYMLTLADACPRFQVRQIGGLHLVNARALSDAFNYIFRVNRQTPFTECDIIASIGYFRNRGLPASWWFASNSENREVRRWLTGGGLQFGHVYPGMIYELSPRVCPGAHGASRQLSGGDDIKSPISIKRISMSEVPLFTRTLVAAFDYPDTTQTAASAWASAFTREDASKNSPSGNRPFADATDGLFGYLAYLEGQPSACIALYVSGETAGIYCVGTVPEARKRGLASKLVKHVLNEARALGCSIVTLQASEMGAPLYQHLGFQKVCDYHMWVDSQVPKRVAIRRGLSAPVRLK